METAAFLVAHHLVQKRDPVAGIFHEFVAIAGEYSAKAAAVQVMRAW